MVTSFLECELMVIRGTFLIIRVSKKRYVSRLDTVSNVATMENDSGNSKPLFLQFKPKLRATG